MIQGSLQATKVDPSGEPIQTGQDFIRRQPFLALSGLGAAIGSMSTIARKLKMVSLQKLVKLPKSIRIIPKYMKSNYVKYPALLIIMLATTRKLRSMINQ